MGPGEDEDLTERYVRARQSQDPRACRIGTVAGWGGRMGWTDADMACGGGVDGSCPETGACSQPGGDVTGGEGGVFCGALDDDADRGVAVGVADVQ